MAMTPNEQRNFFANFNEMRSTLSKAMPNDKSENTRGLWAIVWMLSVINQDLVGIFNELDYTNQVQRTQQDAVNKQMESFQKRMAESQKDAPKTFEEFQKAFKESFEKAQAEAEAQITPEQRKQAAENLRKMADEVEAGKSGSDLKERAAASNLHPIDKDTVEGEEQEDGTVDTYSVHFPDEENNDQ